MIKPYLRNPYRLGSKRWSIEQQFTLNNFGGGLNNVEPDNVIRDNEFTDTENMRFIGNTLLEKRQGLIPLELPDTPPLPEAMTFADVYTPVNKPKTWVIATDKEIYIGGKKICDLKGRAHGVNYVGKYYFVDGSDLHVYDGTDCYRIISEPFSYLSAGFAKQDKVIHVDKIPEQAKIGDSLWITASAFKDYSGTEKGLSKKITKINKANKTVTIESAFGYDVVLRENQKIPVSFYIPKDDKRTSGDEVYDKENKIAYYLPCILQLEDPYAGNSYIPSKPDIITVHQDKLFVSGDEDSPNAVFISTYDSIGAMPLYFPAGSSVSAKPNGQKIVDLVVFDDALIIGRNEDMYVLYGNSVYPSTLVDGSEQFRLKQMDVSTGFMSSDCGALINNYYVYLGYDGRFYSLNTPTTFVEYLMTRPLPYKCDIYKSPFTFTANKPIDVNTVVYRNEVYFNLGNDTVIVYNYGNMAFTYFKGWKASSIYSDGLNMYVGRSDGKASKWADDSETVYDDLGEPINAILSTKRYDLGLAINFKYFKRFMITTRIFEGLTCNLNVNYEIDYFTQKDGVELDSSYGGFGISKWGKSLFQNQDILKSDWLNLDIRGRSIKFIFSNNNLNEPMRIYDVNVLWGIRDIR